MLQNTYNDITQRIQYYKKYIYYKKELNYLIKKLEKMLDNEYKYGSSAYEHKLIQKYMDACENLIHL